MAEKPVPLKSLKQGSYVMIDGEPCRVVSTTKSKPGKHGAAKMRVEGQSLFDGRKHYLLKPASEDVMSPIIEKKMGQVLSVSGNIVQLMDMGTYETFDAEITEELKGKLEPGQEISYWVVCGKVMLKG